MSRALALAAHGLTTSTPNPRVGCVIVKDGQIVGEGWHRRAGEPHAEAVALEPCSHHGRTPPCADALVAANVARVIAAMEDPNPKVRGRGLTRLRESGVEVRCGLLAAPARELNIGFVSRMTRGRPWVRAKIAASLDGTTALADGSSQWITGEAARIDGHRWRSRACAILTGYGTVRDDDPQLNVRHVETERQPLRVVVDSRLETPPAARVLAGGNTLLAYAVEHPERAARLREQGAELLAIGNAAGKVDLPALLTALGERGINELHLEAGFKLNGSMLRENCIDEWLMYMAPCFLGPGAGIANLPALTSLQDRQQFALHSVEQIGDDLRLLVRRPAVPDTDLSVESLPTN